MRVDKKHGYKFTEEFGLIPNDWEVVELQDVANFGGGTTPSRSLSDRYFKQGTHYWVKTLDLNNGLIKFTDEKITETALKETSLKEYPIGTVLIAMYGGFNQIGRTGLLAIPASINQALVAIQSHESLNPYFLIQNLNFNVEYWKSVASSSRKDPNITSDDIKKYKLTLPPKSEQERIAEVLSDVDSLIDKTLGLINKKKNLKTATMQKLLTGKTRLPQFCSASLNINQNKASKQTELGEIPNDWEVVTIKDRCETFSGGTPATSIREYYGGNIKWITSSDLNKGYIWKVENTITELGLQNSSAKEVTKDTLLLALYGATAGVVAITKIDATINQAVLAIIPKEDNYLFLYYWFALNKKSIIDTYTQGGQANLSGDIVRNISLVLPKSHAEQTAIATILSDMDLEIEMLEKELNKYQDLKTGMMQQLLTGKVRLL